jgi:UDP-glucose 4-epimerase
MAVRKNVLITGVAGLLGSRLARWITVNRPDYEVFGIDDLSGGFRENVPPGVQFLKFNLEDQARLEQAFKQFRPSIVYHFAAYAAEGLSPFIRTYNYRNNLLVTSDIVNHCINFDVKRLVFTSSMAVYGHGDGGLFDEDQTPKPIDPYGVAKFASEMDIQIAGEQHGLDWCIIRPHNLYGKNQNIWDKYRNVIGIWMRQYLEGEKMTIYGDGSQKRAFSYVDDCLEPLWKAGVDSGASREMINLGGIKPTTILEVNQILRKVIGGGDVLHLEPRYEVKHAVPTYQKSVDLLDYCETKDLESGIEEMWEWVRKQPQRDTIEWKEFEIEKELYEFWS